MPQATFSGRYLHADLTEMAAAYLYYLVRTHPFLDGNKRAGLMAALVLLGLNGLELEADANGLTELVLGVAAGKGSKAETTVFIERLSRARRA
jgi:death on curing protein